MQERTIEQWEEILNKLPAPVGMSIEQHIANRVLGDLVAYSHRSKHRERDIKELANAMQAYGRLVQGAGLKV